MPEIAIRQVDLTSPSEVEALVQLIDAYACHPMGGGEPLPAEVRAVVGQRYATHPAALAWIAWDGEKPVGGVVGLLCFATFQAKSRINIHDLSVIDGYRDQGIGWQMLQAVEDYARATDCCALTLEVRADNERGRHLYSKFGFKGATEWSPPETMAFWKKVL